MLRELVYFLDLFGVAVFAVSGALAATRKQMDLFGVVVLATVTGIGGGSLRDMLLDIGPVFWVIDPTYVLITTAAALFTMLVRWHYRPPGVALLVADAFGLALFSVLGAQKALAAGAPGVIAVVMGILTGVAGGAIRDLLSGEIPLVLRREIYATAAFAGASVFVLLRELDAEPTPAALIGLLCALLLRLAAIRWRLSLPALAERSG